MKMLLTSAALRFLNTLFDTSITVQKIKNREFGPSKKFKLAQTVYIYTPRPYLLA